MNRPIALALAAHLALLSPAVQAQEGGTPTAAPPDQRCASLIDEAQGTPSSKSGLVEQFEIFNRILTHPDGMRFAYFYKAKADLTPIGGGVHTSKYTKDEVASLLRKADNELAGREPDLLDCLKRRELQKALHEFRKLEEAAP